MRFCSNCGASSAASFSLLGKVGEASQSDMMQQRERQEVLHCVFKLSPAFMYDEHLKTTYAA